MLTSSIRNNRTELVIWATSLALGILASSAQGDTVAIGNPSFESPSVTSTTYGYDWWSPLYSGSYVSPGSAGYFGTTLSDWALAGGQYCVVDSRTANVPTGSFFVGKQALDFYCDAAEAAESSYLGGRAFQMLTTQYAANTTYTLAAHVAKHADGNIGYGGYALGLATQNQYVAGICDTDSNRVLAADTSWEAVKTIGNDVADNAWTAVSLSFTTPAAGGPIGQEIVVVLASGVKTTGVGGVSTFFDGVTLSAAAVPEPRPLTLIGAGLLGVLAFAWRKQR
jgi:hypothetical protein